MGQYWMLLNLDKHERSEHLGKLGEFWGSGTDTNLFYRLLVPVESLPATPLVGGWAGHRLVCIGDYADTPDLPPTLLTAEELAALQASGTELYHLAQEQYTSTSDQAANISDAEANAAYPNGKKWVLRNLTKKVYVDLAAFEAENIGDVEQILLTYICWSSDGDSTLEHDITGGAWAGDRFDINVTESVLDEAEGENQWKDETAEVVEFVGKIWRSNE